MVASTERDRFEDGGGEPHEQRKSKDSPLEPWEPWFQPNVIDFSLLASRTVRELISVVLKHQVYGPLL